MQALGVIHLSLTKKKIAAFNILNEKCTIDVMKAQFETLKKPLAANKIYLIRIFILR